MDSISDSYGSWMVVSKEIAKRNGHKYILCRCVCGFERYVDLSSLRCNRSTRCSSCAGKTITLPEGFRKTWSGNAIGELSGTMFTHIKSKATERSLEFSVTKQFLSDLFELQSRKCALSGMEITLSKDIKNGGCDFSKITASLDRIDSKKGYTTDNVQWIHKDLNRMKMAYDNQYFIDMCIKVAEFNNKLH